MPVLREMRSSEHRSRWCVFWDVDLLMQVTHKFSETEQQARAPLEPGKTWTVERQSGHSVAAVTLRYKLMLAPSLVLMPGLVLARIS